MDKWDPGDLDRRFVGQKREHLLINHWQEKDEFEVGVISSGIKHMFSSIS